MTYLNDETRPSLSGRLDDFRVRVSLAFSSGVCGFRRAVAHRIADNHLSFSFLKAQNDPLAKAFVVFGRPSSSNSSRYTLQAPCTALQHRV